MPVDPTRSRPRFPAGYGIASDDEGMLDWSWAEERLVTSRNYWIVTTREDGSPHVAPVWGLWVDDALVFGTSPESRKARNLERDRRVAMHLESGDEAVIVEGLADRTHFDERMADLYAAKYDFRPDPGPGWWRIDPRVALAWLESDYPSTATRFRF
jgi:hypothetical protein